MNGMVRIKNANILFDQVSVPEKKLPGEFIRPRWEKFIHKDGLLAFECQDQGPFPLFDRFDNMDCAGFGAHQ